MEKLNLLNYGNPLIQSVYINISYACNKCVIHSVDYNIYFVSYGCFYLLHVI